MKTEDKHNRQYARSDAKNRQRGGRGGGKSTKPALKPSIERKGDIKYHTANEKRMREKAAQESDDDGWGVIGEDDGKAAIEHNDNGTDEPNGNLPDQTGHTALQTSQRDRDPTYIPLHKGGVAKRTLKEPPGRNMSGDNNTEEEDLIVLGDKPKEKIAPLPPQRLVDRMKLLDMAEKDAEGGVRLI